MFADLQSKLSFVVTGVGAATASTKRKFSSEHHLKALTSLADFAVLDVA